MNKTPPPTFPMNTWPIAPTAMAMVQLQLSGEVQAKGTEEPSVTTKGASDVPQAFILACWRMVSRARAAATFVSSSTGDSTCPWDASRSSRQVLYTLVSTLAVLLL